MTMSAVDGATDENAQEGKKIVMEDFRIIIREGIKDVCI